MKRKMLGILVLLGGGIFYFLHILLSKGNKI